MIALLFSIIVILIILLIYVYDKMCHYEKLSKEIKHSKQSQSVKYGQMSEQFMPFIKHYPWNSQNFNFLGKPIDGIQFESDKIIFVEFKINKSRMTEKQKNVKRLVEDGKVYFKEVRI